MSEVSLDVTSGVAIVGLHAPDRGNSLTLSMAHELRSVVTEVDADPAIGAMVITGEGRQFCTGAHRSLLATVGEDPAEGERFALLGDVYEAFFAIGTSEVPVVAAVQGAAIGAGVNLALSADVRLVTESTRFDPGFPRLGLHPGGGHLALADALMGRQAATALSVLGESMTGADAVRTGLAWELLPESQLLERAVQLGSVAGSDPELSRRCKKSLRQVSRPTTTAWEHAVDAERAAQMWSLRRRARATGSEKP